MKWAGSHGRGLGFILKVPVACGALSKGMADFFTEAARGLRGIWTLKYGRLPFLCFRSLTVSLLSPSIICGMRIKPKMDFRKP